MCNVCMMETVSSEGSGEKRKGVIGKRNKILNVIVIKQW